MILRAVLWAGVRLVAQLPWRMLECAGAALGVLAGSVLRIRRRVVVAAMARAEVAAPKHAARAMYASLGTSLCELLWLAGQSAAAREQALTEHFTMADAFTRALMTARARGPVILAASHTSNWELVMFGAARSFVRLCGARTCVVVKPISVGVFQAFCTHLREACGITLVAPQGALTRACRHLAAGDIVAMAIDQVPDRERHGIRVPFLGAPALADRAPATLAKLTNATLLVVGAFRCGGGQHLELLAEIAPPAKPQPEWVTDATRMSQRALEEFVRLHPSSWLWLHRRWREPLLGVRVQTERTRPLPVAGG